MSSAWPPIDRPDPASTRSDGAVAPISFLRRLAELTHVPHDAASIALAHEHADLHATWQQTLAQQCAAIGMVSHRVLWSLREAFGAAGRGVALVSTRRSTTGPLELFALDEYTRLQIRVSLEDGSSRRLDLRALAAWLEVEDLDEVRSWLVVESRHPASSALPFGSDPDHAAGHHGEHGDTPPLPRLLALIRSDRADLWAILAYAATIGALSLATPVAVQQLVNSIAFGGLIQPVIVLALLLLVVLGLSALLSLIQTFVTELIQQRIFVRVVVDIAERIPRVQAQAFDRQHGPELVNRIFEVVAVQKSLSTLLLEGTSALLQIAVGLLILSFYHPLMLAFSFLLILGIFVVVVVMGKNAVPTAIRESKAKYDVFGWIEELARHPATFRDADQRRFARGRVDTLASAWVGARREHFRILLRQHGGALGLQVVASAALLALGGMLVVQGQLTLGQLVASELIITTVVSTVAKFGKHLERYYDLMAATDKLGMLIDLPLERDSGDELAPDATPAAIELVGVGFGYAERVVFSGLDLRIAPGERVAIEGSMGSGKSTLLDLLFRLREPGTGHVTIDDRDYRELSIESLRESVALVRSGEIFAGTIRENVRVGRRDYDDAEMLRVLDAVGLVEEIRDLPRGLDTRLSTDGGPLSEVQITRIMIARAVLTRPRLLLLDRALEDFDRVARERICELLFAPDAPWTLVVVSEREDVLARCGRRIRLGAPETWLRKPGFEG
jgi:putative ABC transport system ATP-binding protein